MKPRPAIAVLPLMKLEMLLAAVLALRLAGQALPAQTGSVKRVDGSSITAAEIDATVTRLMKAGEVTGAGITIFNGGKVAYSKAYGYRDTENKLPLTANSVLTAASFTKVAFGYLVMQLVEQHTLELDRPIDGYLAKPLPEYPAYQDLASDPRYKKITVRMLLSHTAGFPNFRTLNPDRKLNINFEPGTKFAYSGEGILLLQFLVETVTKRPLQDLMQHGLRSAP